MSRGAEPILPRPLSPQRLGAIRGRLLRWYDDHVQPFPWRQGGDPYAALVAAVCAQQTQMPRVLQIYERWMAAFPTLADVAEASEAEVLQVWGRAGYPRRAQYLHRCCRIVRDEYGGELPKVEAELIKLPGVGPFTAAIVLCFGYRIDAAAVDTNIVRLLGRVLFGDLQPALETAPADMDWAVRRLMPRGQALRWNPALMDFGAKVCAPRPGCDGCPLATLCAARDRFAAGERARPVGAQGAFNGSRRQVRGAIMAILRASHSAAGDDAASYSVARYQIAAQVAAEIGAEDQEVEAAVISLLQDKLISETAQGLRLGGE